KELGALFRAVFFNRNPQVYIALTVIVLFGAFWWLR
ncbi:MAG: Formate hydrogenlyase subunit 3/multisubunit Na+/H+ antiporter, MnhD subunit, partial [Mesotoga prima]